tara:strand:+ start:414 stop:647 length:234 start_codon:yes stop_codon:yes gene_type:complete
MYVETKKRSLIKAIIWRLIAIFNSFIVLLSSASRDPLESALVMNLTGFVIYFFYERGCNEISWGKENKDAEVISESR